MLCPACQSKCERVYQRSVEELYSVVHRGYKCLSCNMQFKTTEKVLFTSLPNYIREPFLSEGKRGR